MVDQSDIRATHKDAMKHYTEVIIEVDRLHHEAMAHDDEIEVLSVRGKLTPEELYYHRIQAYILELEALNLYSLCTTGFSWDAFFPGFFILSYSCAFLAFDAGFPASAWVIANRGLERGARGKPKRRLQEAHIKANEKLAGITKEDSDTAHAQAMEYAGKADTEQMPDEQLQWYRTLAFLYEFEALSMLCYLAQWPQQTYRNLFFLTR